MNGYLLDTHVWLRHVFEDADLPRALRRLIDGSLERCWLSPASVWELGLLVERGRVQLDLPLREWMEMAHERIPLRKATLSSEVAVRTHELPFDHRDPADRFLAATALVYGLTLVTVDPVLVDADWLPTRSR